MKNYTIAVLLSAAIFTTIGCGNSTDNTDTAAAQQVEEKAAPSPTEQLVGEWTGNSNGEDMSYIFDEEGYATLTSGNNVMGGKSFVVEGQNASMKYMVNTDENPMWLDLVLYEEGSDMEKGRMKGIARFITDDKMEYRVSFNPAEGRPANFDPEDKNNTILLTRTK
ncbi:MAG: hypothetical protein H6551_13390 [Chitinophagales bacterium]|nr:hypothetical protein [Chitinophagaceae bacterium]MCB9066127.1 hypothetical protein [Chitinophagales bacterium]